jgi:hypothetical protein
VNIQAQIIERFDYTVTVDLSFLSKTLESLSVILESLSVILESLSASTSGALSEGDPRGTKSGTKNTGSMRHRLFIPTQYPKFE